MCSASLLILIVWGKDWRQIIVYDLEVVPNRVRTFEGTPVIAHCRSFSLTNWTYQRFGCNEMIFLTNEPYSLRTPFIYHILNRSIILNNLRATDSGLFYCHVTNNTGDFGSVTFSSSIRVFVEAYNEEASDYVVIPNYIEVSEGDSVTLRCKSDKPMEWFSSRLKYVTVIGKPGTTRHLRIFFFCTYGVVGVQILSSPSFIVAALVVPAIIDLTVPLKQYIFKKSIDLFSILRTPRCARFSRKRSHI